MAGQRRRSRNSFRQPIEIVVGDLPGILHSVQEGLQGFLSLTKQWATRHVPTLAEDLAARLDESNRQYLWIGDIMKC